MSVIQHTSGPRSAVIEYTVGSDYVTILEEIHDFVVAHGQEAVDATRWDSGNYKSIMTYRALNKDNVTYKYIQLSYYNTGIKGFTCGVFESYNATTKIGTNQTQGCNTPSFNQNCDPLNQNGRLHLFATVRYFCMLHIGVEIGSNIGNGATGCFETTQANDGDDTPNFCQLNTFLATGNYNDGNYRHAYVACFPRTSKYTGTNASYYNKFSTPIGDQGGGIQTGSSNLYYSMQLSIPTVPAPFGISAKHHVFDLMVSCNEHIARYLKGKLYGLKAFTTDVGANGDVFRVKCDSDMFLDESGTDLDHFMICHDTFGTFGIPV